MQSQNESKQSTLSHAVAMTAAKLFIVTAMVGLTGCLAIVPSPNTPDMKPLQPVSSVEIQRYLGTWYEQAKYPNRFQLMCVSNTTAQYTLLKDGNLQVTNTCNNDKGNATVAQGEARKQTQPGTLEVTFAPSWTRWLPVVWANYWVVALDPDYRWSVVSEPKRQYLWVLSREKILNDTDWKTITAAINSAGLNPALLERTVQKP